MLRPPSPRSRPPTFPQEVLASIFGSVSHLTSGQLFGGSAPGSSWSTTEAATNASLVCREWRFEAQRALFHSVVLATSEAANAFINTVAMNPHLGNAVRDLVIACDEDDLLDEEGQLETSEKMVEAVAACPRLVRLHIQPLHHAVRESLFNVLRRTSLIVVVWAPPTSAAGDRLRWSEALLLPTDNFVLPTLWYLEVQTRERGQANNVTSPTHRIIPATGDLSSQLSANPFACPAPNMTTVKLHIDLDASTLQRLLLRCPNLQVLEIYLERRYNFSENVLVATGLESIGTSLLTLCWHSNPTLEDSPQPVAPIFDAQLLSHFTSLHTLSVTSTEIDRNVLRFIPKTLTSLEFHSFEEPGVAGFKHLLLAALFDSTNDMGALRELVVHDEVTWWGDANLEILDNACAERHIDFVFVEDKEPEEEDEVRHT
ncbi:hypothetical protein P7C70_g8709, partial [Phenoliferia sp. Uapishka_3]